MRHALLALVAVAGAGCCSTQRPAPPGLDRFIVAECQAGAPTPLGGTCVIGRAPPP